MNKKGLLVVFSGFSGSGKGTLMKRLLEEHKEYSLSISATTRKPREGEQDGREYFFKSEEDFKKMIEDDELIEYANYVGNYYGTPKEYVFKQLKQGRDVILEIELLGALKVKEKYPDTLMLFVTPPDAKTLKERLIGRGTETIDVINDRLKRAAVEAIDAHKYDYLIVNDDLEECMIELHNIIQSEHKKTNRNSDFIEHIKNELNNMTKGE